MQTVEYCYWAIGILVVYLAFMLMQRRYRMLLPSVLHTSIWICTIFLIICQLTGHVVSKQVPDSSFNHTAPFVLKMMVASVIGFAAAHIFSESATVPESHPTIDANVLEAVLRKFRWLPWFVGVEGLILIIFYWSTFGSDIESFAEYRIMSITTEKLGFMGLVQRVSGHVTALGHMYLFLLGYKHGLTGVKVKEFLLYAVLISFTNIAIGGRTWVINAFLPYTISFIFARTFSEGTKQYTHADIKRIVVIVAMCVSLFSVIGILRSGNNYTGNAVDKYLYATDGSRVTNKVIARFPDGTFQYEYGKATLLSNFISSPMRAAWRSSIEDNVGLSVTVPSVMPSLYWDFGSTGGPVFWGVICFVVELLCLRLMRTSKLLGIILLGELSYLLFQSPIGNVFTINMPAFEWLLILWFFRKQIFGNIEGIKPYL